MPHSERLTAAQMGVTTAPNRSHGPRHPDPMSRAEPTGDDLLDQCRQLAETANLCREYRIGAEWHDLADRVAADLPDARRDAAARLATIALGTPREVPEHVAEKWRMDADET